MGMKTGAPRVLDSDMEGRVVSLGHRLTVLRGLAVGMKELGRVDGLGKWSQA